MKVNLKKQVQLFMCFDILGDTIRTGMLDWNISRDRLEDIKNHVFDLHTMIRIVKDYLPDFLDFDKINDYILFHDLPEAISGDITRFEGVSADEIKRVTELSIDFLCSKFSDIIDIESIIRGYEEKSDIESKVVHIFDKIHSATTFIKYQSEKDIDMNDPGVNKYLRNIPFVVKSIDEGKDLADIFYEFHSKSIEITDEECSVYNIKRNDADIIVSVAQSFIDEIYAGKVNNTLFDVGNEFPNEAMIYNRKYKNK